MFAALLNSLFPRKKMKIMLTVKKHKLYVSCISFITVYVIFLLVCNHCKTAVNG